MDDDVEAAGSGKVKKLGIGCAGVLVVVIAIGMFAEPPTPEELAAREEVDAQERAEDASARQAEARSKMDAAEKLTAGQLFNAYQSNEVAAQQALAGKSILIEGTIDGITLDFMDEPVVSLATSNQFMSVQLDFDDEDAAMVSALRPGEQFTAMCDKVSEVAGTPMLDDCVVPLE
ncbi:MAG: hypothetical protein JKX86_07100 [Verrucomicrobiales bacterium]|nr:hypothetical protein [Verrucomicrobiales bacterium]